LISKKTKTTSSSHDDHGNDENDEKDEKETRILDFKELYSMMVDQDRGWERYMVIY